MGGCGEHHKIKKIKLFVAAPLIFFLWLCNSAFRLHFKNLFIAQLVGDVMSVDFICLAVCDFLYTLSIIEFHMRTVSI